MCRPPDILNQITPGDNLGRTIGNQFPGSALEIENEQFLNNGAADWENPLLDDFTAQDENGWDWPQHVQSSGTQVFQQQMIHQVDQGANFGSPMPKMPVNSHNFPTTVFGLPDKNPWKQQVSFENGQPLTWGGNSIPVGPPRASFPSNLANPQIASMMAGPSLGPQEFPMPSSNPQMWNKQDGTEVLDQWVKGTLSAMKPQYSLSAQAAAPKLGGVSQEILNQLKPWSTNENESAAQETPAGQDAGVDDDDATKDKKMRRMLSNRASAKRSRQRRQERLGELEIQTAKLRVENASLARKYNEALEQAQKVQKDNDALRKELDTTKAELSDLKMHKLMSDGGSKQESGKASAHSAANETRVKDELCHEAHSEKKDLGGQDHEDESHGKKRKNTSLSEKGSPRSAVTGEKCNKLEDIEDDLPGLGMDAGIATDEWFESLVQSFDD